MKDALGKLRDYLDDLLGEDSSDKEAARQKLGVDLMDWANRLDAKADKETVETTLQEKADRAEVENRAKTLEEKIAERGVPVGSIDWFATTTPPAGYLKANGSAVGRETYPELFAAIGTAFGEGNGSTTFNLPDLIGKFAEGSAVPGTVKEAGLPDINGAIKMAYDGTSGGNQATMGLTQGDGKNLGKSDYVAVGALTDLNGGQGGVYTPPYIWNTAGFAFKASLSNPIYGASDTVQPPALTLLPCIKAFDVAVNTGLVDVTALAREMAGKTDGLAAAHAAMPSDVYLDLVLPEGTTNSVGNQYTEQALVMPADGYLFWMQQFNGTANDFLYCWLGIFKKVGNDKYCFGTGNIIPGAGSDQWIEAYVPVSKGDQIYFEWGKNITRENGAGSKPAGTHLHFIYANGSAGEAQ